MKKLLERFSKMKLLSLSQMQKNELEILQLPTSIAKRKPSLINAEQNQNCKVFSKLILSMAKVTCRIVNGA